MKYGIHSSHMNVKYCIWAEQLLMMISTNLNYKAPLSNSQCCPTVNVATNMTEGGNRTESWLASYYALKGKWA